MAIDYAKLKAWPFKDVEQRYAAKDSILYALGIGLGHDPMDEQQLGFVYEKNLKTLPTMAVVLGYPGFWIKDPERGSQNVRSDISVDLLSELGARGIEIPFPQREVRMLQGNNTGPVRNSAES
jgi:hypothetical protein